jgi:hypothetical protein
MHEIRGTKTTDKGGGGGGKGQERRKFRLTKIMGAYKYTQMSPF